MASFLLSAAYINGFQAITIHEVVMYALLLILQPSRGRSNRQL